MEGDVSQHGFGKSSLQKSRAVGGGSHPLQESRPASPLAHLAKNGQAIGSSESLCRYT